MTANEASNAKGDSIEQLIIAISFTGSNPSPTAAGLEELEYKCNYFLGDDPGLWHANVPTYAGVVVRDIYPGIDITYGGDAAGQLECEYGVSAGADLGRIQVRYSGAESLLVTESGELVLETTWARFTGRAPRVSRPSTLSRERTGARFVRLSTDKVGVTELSSEEASATSLLVPPQAYITTIGGSSRDGAEAIAVDALGAAYVTGFTQSADFPTADPIQETHHGGGYRGRDAFVTKLSSNGSTPVYSTYLGGSDDDEGYAIAVDTSGTAYVTGYTRSGDFPTSNPCCGGSTYSQACFITKLSTEGDSLMFSTYLGGEFGFAIAVDRQGAVYVTGDALPGGIPLVNAYQDSFQGGIADAFVTKLDPSGSTVVYSTYLGGNKLELGFGIAVDGAGSAYVTGNTSSTDFPLVHPYETVFQGGEIDAFVSKLSSTGESLVYSTYLGGSYDDGGMDIKVDAYGAAYVVGFTQSKDFPTANPFQRTHQDGVNVYGGYDGFVTKFPAEGGRPLYSTYLGGSGWDILLAIAIDDVGSANVTGYTGSINFPTAFPNQAEKGGENDAMAASLSPAGDRLTYGTYLGGSSFDEGHGITMDGSGSLLLAGITGSSDFPRSAPCQACGGGIDVFVARLTANLRGDANNDRQITTEDIIYLVDHLFEDGPGPVPTVASGDVDCDGRITILDIIYLINHLLRGVPAPC